MPDTFWDGFLEMWAPGNPARNGAIRRCLALGYDRRATLQVSQALDPIDDDRPPGRSFAKAVGKRSRRLAREIEALQDSGALTQEKAVGLSVAALRDYRRFAAESNEFSYISRYDFVID